MADFYVKIRATMLPSANAMAEATEPISGNIALAGSEVEKTFFLLQVVAFYRAVRVAVVTSIGPGVQGAT
jgi:hypothetical protein